MSDTQIELKCKCKIKNRDHHRSAKAYGGQKSLL